MARDKVRRLGADPVRLETPDSTNEPVPVARGVSLDELLKAKGLLDDPAQSVGPAATPAEQPKPASDIGLSLMTIYGTYPASFNVKKIAIDLIDPSPYQPRKEFDPERLSLLADAIQASGQLNPILVRPSLVTPGRYELVGGERRWRAFKLLQWAEIEARIKEMTDAEAQVNALTDNEGEPLSDYERAIEFQVLLEDNKHWNLTALSRQVGVSKATITRCMSYFKLPESVLALLEEQPRLIGTRTVAEFAELAARHEDLVVQGIERVANGKDTQQGVLRWIKRQIMSRTTPATIRPLPNHVVASGEVLGKIKVKGNSMEIVCENGVNVTLLAELVKELLSTQHVPKDVEE